MVLTSTKGAGLAIKAFLCALAARPALAATLNKRSSEGPHAPFTDIVSPPMYDNIVPEDSPHHEVHHDDSSYAYRHPSMQSMPLGDFVRPYDEEAMLREASGYGSEQLRFKEPSEDPQEETKVVRGHHSGKTSRRSRKLQQVATSSDVPAADGVGTTTQSDAGGQGYQQAPSSSSGSWSKAKVIGVSGAIGICGMGLIIGGVCCCLECKAARSRPRKRDLIDLDKNEETSLLRRSFKSSHVESADSKRHLKKRSQDLPSKHNHYSNQGVTQGEYVGPQTLPPGVSSRGASSSVDHRSYEPSSQGVSSEYLEAIRLQQHGDGHYDTNIDNVEDIRSDTTKSKRKSRRSRKLQQVPDASTGLPSGQTGSATPATSNPIPEADPNHHQSAAEGFNNAFDPKKGHISPLAIVGGVTAGVITSAGCIICAHNVRTGKCKCRFPCKRSLPLDAEEEELMLKRGIIEQTVHQGSGARVREGHRKQTVKVDLD